LPRPPTWIRFRALPAYDADEIGVSAAADAFHSAEAGIHVQDGLLFYAKEAHYELGLTPVVLAWKDHSTSRHAIETFPEPAHGGALGSTAADSPLVVTLAHAPARSDPSRVVLTTCDRPPLVMAETAAAEIRALGSCASARLVRFRVENPRDVAHGAQPELVPIGLAGPNRLSPDSWSRVLFQSKIRHCPLSIDHLKAAPVLDVGDGA
jgi:snurportin-1